MELEPGSAPSAILNFDFQRSDMIDDDDEVCSQSAERGSDTDKDDDGKIHVRVRYISGNLVGSAAVDQNATIGQLRARLAKPIEWYAEHKYLAIGSQSFELGICYTRFTLTEACKNNIWRDEKGMRTLDAVVSRSRSFNAAVP